MTIDRILWEAARVAALTAFAVIAASILTGMAIRTGYLAPIARNRAVTTLHGFLSWFWAPLVVVHVGALALDSTARIGLVDTVIPFEVGYARLAIGLGTLGLLVLALTLATTLLRHHMSPRLWRWLHRLTYPMFVMFLLHAQLAGTDFSHTAVSVMAWATLGATMLLSVPRLFSARMESATR